MASFSNFIWASPVALVAGLCAIGAALAFIGLGTPAAAAFMLAGMFIMMFSGGRQTAPASAAQPEDG